MATRTTNAPTKTEAAKKFQTRNNIAAENQQKLVALLNQHLADMTDLYTQTKYAHWNVKGPTFIALHKLFDELAEKVEHHIDEIAERTTALGGVATGTLRQAATASQVSEFPTEMFHGQDVVEVLADRFGAVANVSREAIDIAEEYGDQVTSDLFIRVTDDLDQSLYFLEAHLQ